MPTNPDFTTWRRWWWEHTELWLPPRPHRRWWWKNVKLISMMMLVDFLKFIERKAQ